MKSCIYVPAYRSLVHMLRTARRRAGLTQAVVGERIDRNRQFVHLVETCQVRLDIVQTCRLARLYGLKAHNLVRRMEEELPAEGDSFLPIRSGTAETQRLFQKLWGSCGVPNLSSSGIGLSRPDRQLSTHITRNLFICRYLDYYWLNTVATWLLTVRCSRRIQLPPPPPFSP